MPVKVEPRASIPLLRFIRDRFRGRTVVESVRFPKDVAPRTQPPPTIPYGPHHKTSKVYYYARDARRLVGLPTEVYTPNKPLQIGTSDAKDDAKVGEVKQITPGKFYDPPLE